MVFPLEVAMTVVFVLWCSGFFLLLASALTRWSLASVCREYGKQPPQQLEVPFWMAGALVCGVSAVLTSLAISDLKMVFQLAIIALAVCAAPCCWICFRLTRKARELELPTAHQLFARHFLAGVRAQQLGNEREAWQRWQRALRWVEYNDLGLTWQLDNLFSLRMFGTPFMPGALAKILSGVTIQRRAVAQLTPSSDGALALSADGTSGRGFPRFADEGESVRWMWIVTRDGSLVLVLPDVSLPEDSELRPKMAVGW